MSRVSSLFQLQEIDLEIDQSQARIEEIESILEQDEEIRNAHSLLERREQTLSKSRADNSSAEHAVALQREKIANNEAALYGGSVTNPKELQDLQMELESLKRHLETLEDRYLEAMVALEQAEQAHLEAMETLDVLQQRKSRENKQLSEEKDQLINNLQRLDEQRQAAVTVISETDASLYLDLRQRLNGKALAVVSEGVCSACGVELARSKQQEVSSGNELIRCSQCSRILYAG
jgi:predicted  nucleic acid-binding Zn-ribbon protein